MKKLCTLFLALLLLGQLAWTARADGAVSVSASGDADAGTVLLAGSLPDCGGGELTVRIVSDGENPDVLYLNQLTLPQDGSFSLTCPVSLPAGADAVYTLNCQALAQSLTGRVRMRMAFTELAVSGDAAGVISVSGCLAGQAGAQVGVIAKTGTGRELVRGSFTADAQGRFAGTLAASLRAGDVLALDFSADMAKPASVLTVVPGSPAETACLEGFSVAFDEAAGSFTVTGSTSPAGVRTLTLLVTKADGVVYLDELQTDAAGAFAVTFPAAMRRGERFVFRVNGGTLEAGGEQTVLIPYLFENVRADGDAALDQVTFSGSIPGFGAGTAEAELTTATGRQLWRGSAVTDAGGAFSQTVPLALEEGDALWLKLTAADATPCAVRFVVPRAGGPGTARLAALTIEPDVDAGVFLVTGTAEPAGVRELTIRVSRDGNQLYLDQFDTDADGAFSLRVPVAMLRGQTFLFYFNGATLAESVERSVTVPQLSAVTGGTQTVRHNRFLSGYPDGTFRPDAGLTRAEAAMLFARLLSPDYAFSGDFDAGFQDVAADAWYADCVGFLRQQGLTEGYPDGTFRPDAPVTRAEFTAMAVRFGQLTQAERADFADVTASHWACGYIGRAAEQGWVTGYPDGTFRPDAGITRGETAVLVSRLLGRDCAETCTADQTGWLRFTDVPESHWASEQILFAANTHTSAG